MINNYPICEAEKLSKYINSLGSGKLFKLFCFKSILKEMYTENSQSLATKYFENKNNGNDLSKLHCSRIFELRFIN